MGNDLSEVQSWKVNKNDLLDMLFTEKEEALRARYDMLKIRKREHSAGKIMCSRTVDALKADLTKNHLPKKVTEAMKLFPKLKLTINNINIYVSTPTSMGRKNNQIIDADTSSHNNYDTVFNAIYRKSNPTYGISLSDKTMTITFGLSKIPAAIVRRYDTMVKKSIIETREILIEFRTISEALADLPRMKRSMKAQLTRKALSDTAEGAKLLENMKKTLNQPLKLT